MFPGRKVARNRAKSAWPLPSQPRVKVSKTGDGSGYLTHLMREDALNFYLHQLYYIKKSDPFMLGECLGGDYQDPEWPGMTHPPEFTAQVLMQRFGDDKPQEFIRGVDPLILRRVSVQEQTETYFSGKNHAFLLTNPATGMLIPFGEYSREFSIPLTELVDFYLRTIRETL